MQSKRHNMIRPFAVLAVLGGLFAFATVAQAQDVPDVLPYQGFLTDGTGAPVDGTADIVFALYGGAADAAPVWTESHTGVLVEKGVFYVYLGQTNALLEYFTDGSTMYLGINVNNDGEATPRQEIGSVPYALLAGNAQNLGGIPANQFLTEQQIIELIQQYGGGKPYVLGLSAHTDDGSWDYNGVEGVDAANAACADAYPGEANAHMCSVEEARSALYAGDHAAGAAAGTQAWAVATNTIPPGGNRLDNTLGNTCQDLLYNSGDVAIGTSLALHETYTSVGNDAGNVGPAAVVRDGIPCGSNLPVYCCR